MWVLRKRLEDLTMEDKELLKKLFEHSPQLVQAYRLRNELTGIFDSDLPRRRAKQRITGWMNRVKASSVHCFDSFLKTLILLCQIDLFDFFQDTYPAASCGVVYLSA